MQLTCLQIWKFGIEVGSQNQPSNFGTASAVLQQHYGSQGHKARLRCLATASCKGVSFLYMEPVEDLSVKREEHAPAAHRYHS